MPSAALRGIPRRKAVLQRQDEHVPERRITTKPMSKRSTQSASWRAAEIGQQQCRRRAHGHQQIREHTKKPSILERTKTLRAHFIHRAAPGPDVHSRDLRQVA